MKRFLCAMLVVFMLVIVGCSRGNIPAQSEKSGADQDGDITQLEDIPHDFCIVYTSEAEGIPEGTEIEYCIKENDRMTKASAAGIEIITLCLGDVGKLCSEGICYDDSEACNSIDVPFGSVDVPSDTHYYKKAPSRLVGGLSATCYTINMRELPGVNGEELPDEYANVEVCYHPQYKYLLYYSGAGLTTQVKSFVMPAPAEKFAVSE